MLASFEIADLITANSLFVVNHSGGKDSQAMLIALSSIIPKKQLLVVHATLGQMEWPGALEHAEKQALGLGVTFLVAKANKTLLSMVRNRFATRPSVPSWPSSEHRQCTSDLKRGPIEREVRRFAEKHGFRTIVNCVGIRAEESIRRSKLQTWKKNCAQSNSKRIWYDWLPIHDLKTDEVFSTIANAGQQPHPAYGLGNDRLSCVFCIMGSDNDLRIGALQNPKLYAEYVTLERRTGYSMHQSRRFLEDITGVKTRRYLPVLEAA